MPRIISYIVALFLGCCLGVVNLQAQGTAYNYRRLVREKLARGVVAIRTEDGRVAISWRYLSQDAPQTAFNVYRNGVLLTPTPQSASTLFFDHNPLNEEAEYEVRPVLKGKEFRRGIGRYLLKADAPIGYVNIPVRRPEGGVTPAQEPYTYSIDDTMVGDADGDGEYEFYVCWEPSNRHDNAHDGYTGNVLLDAYRITGEFLWRIDLGRNIRAGDHYTQVLVYDFDGDNRCEVIMRTADGCVDGKGVVIGDADADYRESGYWKVSKKRRNGVIETDSVLRNQGRILRGKEYLTVFSGLTGEALYTTDYLPERGDPMDWGDDRANRSDRFLATVAYLDGKRPSAVMCRGYYTRSVLAAFDWNGKRLSLRWLFDSNTAGNEAYSGEGNHNLRVGDVDGDGCDEIIYGSCAIDHDGTGLYATGMGHGDAIHLTQFDPQNPRLQVWACHENRRDGSSFRDAASGEIIFQKRDTMDVGRCLAADIDPTNYGVEMWSIASDGILNINGQRIARRERNVTINMAVWWDGDLSRELLNKTFVAKYDPKKRWAKRLVEFKGAESNHGSKAVPALAADVIGDWREEVLLRAADNTALRIYISTFPTPYRFHTFLEEPIYRISVATQNVGYCQPTQPGFYFGSDMPEGEFRGYTFEDRSE